MPYFPRWKIILVLGVCVLALLSAMPNVLPASATSWLATHSPLFAKTVNLGLDLRGGSHLLLEVQTKAVITERTQSLAEEIRALLRRENLASQNVTLKDERITIAVPNSDERSRVETLIRELGDELAVTRESEGQSAGLSVALREDVRAARVRSALDQSIEIVRRRIDETGTREPSIQRQGDNRIIVQLPGVDDPAQIKRLLGQTAKLSFRLVDQNASSAALAGGGASSSLFSTPPGTERLSEARSSEPSSDTAGDPANRPRTWVVQKRVLVSGESLVDAQPTFQNGEPVVSFKFDSTGAKRFGEATRTNVGRPFAIVLDNKVISAPVIREPILGGSGVISGSFTTQSAQELALLLRAGALPAPITVLEERTVGPGLGSDSIRAGALASVVGLAAVIVFFVIIYGLFGVFASFSLLMTLAFIFAALSLLQATLTLPGIAGIVLTIGTALDANVLIFERMREEVRTGRAPIAALGASYDHAFSAIIDANMTTLIAGVILYAVGSGPVRGFAVTLIIGIIASIFTAMLVTRLIIAFWMHRTRPRALPV